MMRATWNGAVLAESDDYKVVEGNYYFPPDSVKREFLRESRTVTLCPWKGVAHYYDIEVGGRTNRDAAWYYPRAWPLARKIRGYVAFWNGISVEEGWREATSPRLPYPIPGASLDDLALPSNNFAGLPSAPLVDLPLVDKKQMIEIDRLMVEETRIGLVQMMENAGYQLARLARTFTGPGSSDKRILIVAGKGANGGGGLAAARRLHGWGEDVSVTLTAEPEDFKSVPKCQLDILGRLGVETTVAGDRLPPHDLIIDAIIGYSLEGPTAGLPRTAIAACNDSPAPVISLDVPSGIDVDSGTAAGVAVKADLTMTLALPKLGFANSQARQYLGRLFLADIGVPASVLERVGLSPFALFRESSLVRVRL